MAKAKLILRVNTKGAKAGDEIETDSETAQALVDNRLAFRKKDAPQSKTD